MKIEINKIEFVELLQQDKNNVLSKEACEEIFYYYEALEIKTGEDFEFTIEDIERDWKECSLDDVCLAYEIDSLEDLPEKAPVFFELDNGNILVRDF